MVNPDLQKSLDSLDCILKQVLKVGQWIEFGAHSMFQAYVKFHWLDWVPNLEKGLNFGFLKVEEFPF